MAGSCKQETQQQTYRLAYLMGKRRLLYGFFKFAQERANRLCAVLCDRWISPAATHSAANTKVTTMLQADW